MPPLPRLLWLLALLLLAGTGARAAEESLWLDDLNAALDKAEKENKDILIDFTGSDWCSWCIKLKEEVFDQPQFMKDGAAQFVLLEVDFPRQKPVKAGNEMLRREFNVEGFPTLFLADAKGRVYAKTGYRDGGPEKYLAHLAELKKVKAERDEVFAQAARAQGVEKAKLLDKGLALLDDLGFLMGYSDEVDQIMKADADGKAGLRRKYELRRRTNEIEKVVAAGEDLKGVVAKVDATLKDLAPEAENKQYLLYLKAAAFAKLQDKDAASAALQAAVDVNPLSEVGQRLAQVLEKLKAPDAPQLPEESGPEDAPKKDAAPAPQEKDAE